MPSNPPPSRADCTARLCESYISSTPERHTGTRSLRGHCFVRLKGSNISDRFMRLADWLDPALTNRHPMSCGIAGQSYRTQSPDHRARDPKRPAKLTPRLPSLASIIHLPEQVAAGVLRVR
eukprot:2898967-Rhodomonas_salina.2